MKDMTNLQKYSSRMCKCALNIKEINTENIREIKLANLREINTAKLHNTSIMLGNIFATNNRKSEDAPL